MEIEWIQLEGAGAALDGIAVVPDQPTRMPLLMIHENRGLQPYMLDVAGALAEAGHPVVSPDLLSRVGGTSRTSEDPSLTTRAVPPNVHEADLVAVFDAMVDRHGKVGVFGFCFGGEMGWRLVTKRTPERAVLFYGIGPDPVDVPSIACPVYAVYAEDDPRVNDTLPPLCAALQEAGTDAVLESWPGTKHAFHDHSRPERHHPDAAAAVWEQALAFLG